MAFNRCTAFKVNVLSEHTIPCKPLIVLLILYMDLDITGLFSEGKAHVSEGHESHPVPNIVINGLQRIPTGRPFWPIRVSAAASTPPPSGRTGALSSQLPFCGRGYSAKAGEGLKQTAKKPTVLISLLNLVVQTLCFRLS